MVNINKPSFIYIVYLKENSLFPLHFLSLFLILVFFDLIRVCEGTNKCRTTTTLNNFPALVVCFSSALLDIHC